MGVSKPGTPPIGVGGAITGVELTYKAGFDSVRSGSAIIWAASVGERAGLHSGHKKLYGGSAVQ